MLIDNKKGDSGMLTTSKAEKNSMVCVGPAEPASREAKNEKELFVKTADFVTCSDRNAQR